jgi:hypothetical protein
LKILLVEDDMQVFAAQGRPEPQGLCRDVAHNGIDAEHLGSEGPMMR